MSRNGLKRFAFTSQDESAPTARALRPLVGVDVQAPPGEELKALSAEMVARRYLSGALASDKLPTFTLEPLAEGQSEFRSLGTEALPLTGTRTVKFRQVYRKIPIYGSLVTVELDENNELLSISSAMGEPAQVDAVAHIAPSQALDVVRREAGYGDVALEVVPQLRFYFDASAQRWRLVYITQDVPKHSAPASAMPQLSDFVVDAQTGEFVGELPRTQSTGQPLQIHAVDARGQERLIGCSQEGDTTQLYDVERNVRTYDFGFQDVSLETGLPGLACVAPWDPGAVSAHANAAEVALFLKDVLKREGLDNRGGSFVSSINCTYGESPGGHEWRNAAWIGTQMVYGQRLLEGRLLSYAVAEDVVAHEITHGLTGFTARLQYQGETGALNESYSDIFGILVANRHEPDVSRWDWRMGEELSETGVPLRDLSQPSKYGQPEHMRDFVPLPLDALHDWGGVHRYSGIHNRAAYLILTAKDASGRPLFTPAEVAALFYLTLTQRLSRTSTFSDSRRGMLLSARSLFRADAARSDRLQALEAAFDAVGIT
ncbi:M4 family metallopeptidase [Myxococcaceae bacterium JPH2]|nr:M4 family metallopeptidase [Myxococcaceae bacterium JPH2]